MAYDSEWLDNRYPYCGNRYPYCGNRYPYCGYRCPYCGNQHPSPIVRASTDLGAVAVQVGSALLHDPTTAARLAAALSNEGSA